MWSASLRPAAQSSSTPSSCRSPLANPRGRAWCSHSPRPSLHKSQAQIRAQHQPRTQMARAPTSKSGPRLPSLPPITRQNQQTIIPRHNCGERESKQQKIHQHMVLPSFVTLAPQSRRADYAKLILLHQRSAAAPCGRPLPSELGLARVRHVMSGPSRIYPTWARERAAPETQQKRKGEGGRYPSPIRLAVIWTLPSPARGERLSCLSSGLPWPTIS